MHTFLISIVLIASCCSAAFAGPMVHISGAGITVPENEFQNVEITKFLDTVTERGKPLR